MRTAIEPARERRVARVRPLARVATANPRAQAGLTLVEMMIVILVIAILAAAAIPQFQNVSEEVKQKKVANNLRTILDGCVRYKLKTGLEVPDTSSGTWHPDFEGFIDRDSFEKRTPVEGVYDTDDDLGVTSAFGVHFLTGAGTPKDDAYMTEVDALVDDGDLSTGGFRKLGDARYYYILTQ